ncbi:MMPL family transporter [Spirillospora sp. NPDC049024]
MLRLVAAMCARRPWTVIAVWLVLIGAVAAAVLVFGRPTENSLSLPGSDAQRAAEVQAKAFPGEADDASGTLVLHAAAGTLEDPARRDAMARAAERIEAVPHVRKATPASRQAGTVSADGRTGYLTIALDVRARDVDRALVRRIEDAAAPLDAAGVETVPGGRLAEAAERSGGAAREAGGLVVAVVVLLAALGGAVAAGLPIAMALAGLVCGVGAVGLLGHATAIPPVAATLATMIGLGVGIDYSLFVLSRYRTLLARGSGVPEAVRAAVTSSGASVVFAGATVVIALSGLLLGGVPVLRTLAWTSALVVAVAVAVAVTLLPAVLRVLGGRIDALRVLRGRGGSHAPSAVWERLGGRVTARPWRVLIGAAALLAVLTAPVTAMTLGQVDAGSDPAGSAPRRSYELMAEGFGPGSNGPLTVVAVPATKAAGPDDARITGLADAVRRTAGVAAVSAPRLGADGTAAVLRVTPDTAPADPATADLVRRIRALPAAGAEVHVGGPVAAHADLADRAGSRMPLIIGVVLALCAAVLLPAFRAPVVAVKAAVMNLISIGAAYGALTAVFTWGWGVELLGLDGPVPIEGYVPMMLFAVLFGLSMDYEVFLLTAVREEWLRHGDDRRAVSGGLAATGRIISAAALIMVGVFAGFLPHHDPVIKMFGLGMAVAVAVDATVVRGLLVPSAMVLLGRANWWLPGWLDRVLPQSGIGSHAPPPPVADAPPPAAGRRESGDRPRTAGLP